MPGSTRVRVVVIVVVALGGAVAAYQWWYSPERQIRRTIREAVSALSHDEPESNLAAISAAAALTNVLSLDVVVEAGLPASPPLRGRSEVVALAARLRASSSTLRIQTFDEQVALNGDAAANVHLTAQITTVDRSGEELADAQQLALDFVNAGDRWRISRVTIIRIPETP
jgi:hypothetical protein